jgi:hypothetical protein
VVGGRRRRGEGALSAVIARKRIIGGLVVLVVVIAAIVVARVAYGLMAAQTAASESTPTPTPRASARAAAPTSQEVAYAVADRFCRPNATKTTWQRSLSPYLTPSAWQMYSATEPGNVPCAGVHDGGSPVGDQQTRTDQAFQFTAGTGGPVTVTLHRDTARARWLASYVSVGQ